MHIEFHVEELSAQEALQNFLPKILGTTITFDIHAYQGKHNLLEKLPNRLKGYQAWLPDDWHIVVLIDQDREDCKELKSKLEKMASEAGLITKSVAQINSPFQVLNRLTIEELEAWFFGDVDAIVAAYPKVSLNLGQQAPYRNPDQIAGGTWEALERVLQRQGYFPGGLEKINAAREISTHMEPLRNRSKSFQVFRNGLLDMVNREPSS
ncbi:MULTISPECIES: DUF4276 family protein [unclassified Coleofasciculus]|uniref:DUF4276 family protein n=1 Tax=unclassified Coleofasciculus TaxID=2692782 RepID=UPI00187F934F|nr:MULTISPECIES: DUF4276 family protein [unclassified Coleofasciculus]MBE9128126.1 DUF4276 family protein [Coleofasciculus sp. LEGE 07081]MBE9151198.1 DUF4276 family protein [Coleofasciculus sp. LEGE 07092]